MILQALKQTALDLFAVAAVGSLSFYGISKMDTAEMIALGREICEHMLNTYGLRIPEPNEIELQEVHELQSRYA